jgi:hypothetical protein
MSTSEHNCDLIEDIPSSWAKLATQRIIFRAQIQAKVTERTQPTIKIVCKMPISGSLSKWLKDY